MRKKSTDPRTNVMGSQLRVYLWKGTKGGKKLLEKDGKWRLLLTFSSCGWIACLHYFGPLNPKLSFITLLILSNCCNYLPSNSCDNITYAALKNSFFIYRIGWKISSLPHPIGSLSFFISFLRNWLIKCYRNSRLAIGTYLEQDLHTNCLLLLLFR